jgi:hypothetical protein
VERGGAALRRVDWMGAFLARAITSAAPAKGFKPPRKREILFQSTRKRLPKLPISQNLGIQHPARGVVTGRLYRSHAARFNDAPTPQMDTSSPWCLLQRRQTRARKMGYANSRFRCPV